MWAQVERGWACVCVRVCVCVCVLVLCSHIIHKLSFGTQYPGMKNPLDGIRAPAKGPTPDEPVGMYQYFLKVGRCVMG